MLTAGTAWALILFSLGITAIVVSVIMIYRINNGRYGDEAGWIETRDESGDVWPVVGIGIDRPAVINLIIAMHEALPALLDAIDTLRWYADAGNYHDPTDVPDHLYRDSGDVLLIRGGGGQRARAALAKGG